MNLEMVDVYFDIMSATNISQSTLSMVVEVLEDERCGYVVLGVMEQLEIIERAINKFHKIMSRGEGNKEYVIEKISSEK